MVPDYLRPAVAWIRRSALSRLSCWICCVVAASDVRRFVGVDAVSAAAVVVGVWGWSVYVYAFPRYVSADLDCGCDTLVVGSPLSRHSHPVGHAVEP